VVDVSRVVTAVHQNHDYGYHPEGWFGVWNDEQAQRNLQLAGGRGHLLSIADANEILLDDGVSLNPRRHLRSAKRYAGSAKRFLLNTLRISRP
jgi:hypothetical protein